MAKAAKKTDRKNPEAEAQDEVQSQLMQKMGEAPDDSDSGNASRVNANIAAVDPAKLVQMSAQDAFQAAGMGEPSPGLAKVWENLPPNDRIHIFEAINNSAGMGSDDQVVDEAQNISEQTPTGPVGQAPQPNDPRAMLLQKIMGGQ